MKIAAIQCNTLGGQPFLQLRMHLPCLACLVKPQGVTRVHTRMDGCFPCFASPVQTNQALKHTTHNDSGGGHQGVKVRRGCPFTKPHATAAGAHAGSICLLSSSLPLPLPSHKTCLVSSMPDGCSHGAGSYSESSLKMRRDLQLAFRKNPSHCRDNGCMYILPRTYM